MWLIRVWVLPSEPFSGGKLWKEPLWGSASAVVLQEWYPNDEHQQIPPGDLLETVPISDKPGWDSTQCFKKNQCDSENLDHSESLVFVGILSMNHVVVGDWGKLASLCLWRKEKTIKKKKSRLWVGVAVVCSPSTWEIKAGEPKVQSQPPLHSELQVSLGYIR